MKHWRKVIFFLMTILDCGFSTTNVASGKTVTAVSVYCVPFINFPCYPATNLVDDNTLTLAWTQRTTNPYFVVDLGKAYQVTTVYIMGDTGTVDGTYNVGLSANSPSSVVPKPSNYKLCYQYFWSNYPIFGPFTTTANCPRNYYPRRYVVYQEITNNDSLMVGEMQVNVATRRGSRYDRSGGRRLVKDSALIGSPSIVAKRVDCMVLCVKSEDCDSFNFRPSDKTCELHDWGKGVIPPLDTTLNADWDLWLPTYSVTEM